MIIFEIILFFLGIILISTSIAGYGSLINLRNNDSVFINVFLGFIVITSLITFIHFFLNINIVFSLLIFVFGLVIFFYKKKIDIFKLLEKKNIYGLIIIFLYIPMFLSQKYHEDFGYYHLPYALGFLEQKIVFGYANIDKSYVYNSIWLNLYSIFFLDNKNFNFLTLPSYLLFLTFILFSINQIILKKEIFISDYYLITIIFYFILKFTRISEFGVDLPSIIFSILAIYYFLKFSETNLDEEKKTHFFLTTIFSIFAILIKLSTLPIISLPLYIFFKNFNNLKFSIIKIRFFFVIFLCFIFLIQQFIYSGCFLFPTNFTCLNVSWFNPEYLKLSKDLELVNKSYFQEAKNTFSPEQYLNNFNWLYFWIKRNFIEILEHLLTIIIPLIIFIFFLKKNNKNYNYFRNKNFLIFFLILSLLFWLNFSPVYRFAIHLFATLIFVFFSSIFLSKKFSKKVFVIFIISFVFFSFSKNLIRINKIDSLFLGIQKIDNKYLLDEKNSNELAKIFRPDITNNSKNGWQGRLCWNTPFICSWNELEIKKKNNYLFLIKKN